MRSSFLRAFKRFGSRPREHIPIPLYNKKSSPTGATTKTQQRTIMAASAVPGLAYALSVTSPGPLGPVPDDAKDKKHHVKGGFTNPWDSYKDMSGPGIMFNIIK